MANTIHVTLRLPVELVEDIDRQAADESRSRAKVIFLRLMESRNGESVTQHQAMDQAQSRTPQTSTPKAGRTQGPPSKPGEKCPHGWMNSYVCQDGCNT